MLLHSDIARLVLGYLAEENCSQSYQSFLNESIHLNSVRHAFEEEANDTAPVTIFGQSLFRIIDEYYNMKDAEMQIWNIKNRRNLKNKKFFEMWKKLEEAISSVKSLQIASILDGLQVKKSYCKNCESTMTRSGVVITTSTPAGMIYRKNTVRKTMKTTLFQEVVPPPLEISNSSISSASAGKLGNLSKKNRQKKTRSAPKKLSDTERKDKETEFSTDPPSALLHNITGSGAMAVVGAAITTQMKKCAQSEKATCSVAPGTKFDVDANAAKHNHESIAQRLRTDDNKPTDELKRERFLFGKPVVRISNNLSNSKSSKSDLPADKNSNHDLNNSDSNKPDSSNSNNPDSNKDILTNRTRAGAFSCINEPQVELPPSAQQTVTASGADILSKATVSSELPILSSIVATPIPAPTPVVIEPVATCLTETQNLRTWLMGNTKAPAVRNGRRRATVARKYDFVSSGTYQNTPKSGGRLNVFTKRQRKLLPKFPTCKTSACATVAVLDDLPIQNESVAFSTRAASAIIGSTAPSDHPSLHLPSMPVSTSTPVESSTIDVIDSLDVAVATNEVVTSIDSVPQSRVSTITESRLDPSLSFTDSSSKDITLVPFTRQSPMPSVKPLTPLEEPSTEKLSPVKPPLTAISHFQTLSKNPDPIKSPTSLLPVEEKTTIKSSPESRPDRRKSTSIRDSSEEHSLRIVTSDEDRPSVSILPTSRKRKLSRKLPPRKSPRFEKFASSSTNDLVALQGQGESASQDSFVKRKKEKHPKHRLSDPVTIQNSLEIAYPPPSRSSSRRKSFDKHRVTSNLKLSSSKSPSRSRDGPRLRSRKEIPRKTGKAKRLVDPTTAAIPPSKLGGFPMHLWTPFSVLVCCDSSKTIAMIAESLAESTHISEYQQLTGREVKFEESEKELISIASTPTNEITESEPMEDDNKPTDELKTERFLFGKPVVVRISNNLSNSKSSKSDLPADKNSNHDLNNSDSNNPDSSHSNNPDSSHSNNPDSSHSNNPDSSHSNNPDSSNSNNPDSSHSNNPDSSHSNNPDSSNSNNSDSKNRMRRGKR